MANQGGALDFEGVEQSHEVAVQMYDVVVFDRVGTIESITVNANIEHTYRGDIYLELRHGGVSINIFNGHEVDSPWEDNITLEAVEVNGFEGANLAGDWELFAVDTYGYDVGQIMNWSIDFTVSE